MILEGPVSESGRIIRAVIVPEGSAVMGVCDAAGCAWVVPERIPVGWHEPPFLPPAPDPEAGD
jgi:hypothetical protein